MAVRQKRLGHPYGNQRQQRPHKQKRWNDESLSRVLHAAHVHQRQHRQDHQANLQRVRLLTRLVQTLEQRGEYVPEDAITATSPYFTEHINRFGDYILSLARKLPQPDYGYTLKQTASRR